MSYTLYRVSRHFFNVFFTFFSFNPFGPITPSSLGNILIIIFNNSRIFACYIIQLLSSDIHIEAIKVV
jgi:hypothetical protein